jgi:hypothetical protein
VPEAQGGQRRNAAHYHSIVHRKRAGFGAQLPRSWRTADQSRLQSSLYPPNAQKNTRTGNKTPEIAKLCKGLQKNSKKTQKRKKPIKTVVGRKKDVFIGTLVAEYHATTESCSDKFHVGISNVA